MAAGDYKKLGLDRVATNIAKSISSPGGTLSTGNIAQGELVEVSMSSATGTATVKDRRTGAILLSADFGGNAEYKWSISGTTLTVTANGSITGTFTFWVF